MKDTKYIRRDFHSVTWVMPQGWDLGHWGAQGVKKIIGGTMRGLGSKRFFSEIHPDLVCELLT